MNRSRRNRPPARKTRRKLPAGKAAARNGRGAPSEKRAARLTRDIGLRIMSGVYKPGETIPVELEFCAELGVSRAALRETIKQLASKGLVTPRVKLGTVVNPRSRWNFLDPLVLEWLLLVEDIGPFLTKLFDLRTGIEPIASALAARHASGSDRAALREAYAAMAAATDDFEAWIAADLRFHQAIYLGTGNEFFWPVARLLEPALLAGFRVTGRAHHHQQCLPEHREVHDAILARDPERAYRATIALMKTTDTNLAMAMSDAGAHGKVHSQRLKARA